MHEKIAYQPKDSQNSISLAKEELVVLEEIRKKIVAADIDFRLSTEDYKNLLELGLDKKCNLWTRNDLLSVIVLRIKFISQEILEKTDAINFFSDVIGSSEMTNDGEIVLQKDADGIDGVCNKVLQSLATIFPDNKNELQDKLAFSANHFLSIGNALAYLATSSNPTFFQQIETELLNENLICKMRSVWSQDMKDALNACHREKTKESYQRLLKAYQREKPRLIVFLCFAVSMSMFESTDHGNFDKHAERIIKGLEDSNFIGSFVTHAEVMQIVGSIDANKKQKVQPQLAQYLKSKLESGEINSGFALEIFASAKNGSSLLESPSFIRFFAEMESFLMDDYLIKENDAKQRLRINPNVRAIASLLLLSMFFVGDSKTYSRPQLQLDFGRFFPITMNVFGGLEEGIDTVIQRVKFEDKKEDVVVEEKKETVSVESLGIDPKAVNSSVEGLDQESDRQHEAAQKLANELGEKDINEFLIDSPASPSSLSKFQTGAVSAEGYIATGYEVGCTFRKSSSSSIGFFSKVLYDKIDPGSGEFVSSWSPSNEIPQELEQIPMIVASSGMEIIICKLSELQPNNWYSIATTPSRSVVRGQLVADNQGDQILIPIEVVKDPESTTSFFRINEKYKEDLSRSSDFQLVYELGDPFDYPQKEKDDGVPFLDREYIDPAIMQIIDQLNADKNMDEYEKLVVLRKAMQNYGIYSVDPKNDQDKYLAEFVGKVDAATYTKLRYSLYFGQYERFGLTSDTGPVKGAGECNRSNGAAFLAFEHLILNDWKIRLRSGDVISENEKYGFAGSGHIYIEAVNIKNGEIIDLDTTSSNIDAYTQSLRAKGHDPSVAFDANFEQLASGTLTITDYDYSNYVTPDTSLNIEVALIRKSEWGWPVTLDDELLAKINTPDNFINYNDWFSPDKLKKWIVNSNYGYEINVADEDGGVDYCMPVFSKNDGFTTQITPDSVLTDGIIKNKFLIERVADKAMKMRRDFVVEINGTNMFPLPILWYVSVPSIRLSTPDGEPVEIQLVGIKNYDQPFILITDPKYIDSKESNVFILSYLSGALTDNRDFSAGTYKYGSVEPRDFYEARTRLENLGFSTNDAESAILAARIIQINELLGSSIKYGEWQGRDLIFNNLLSLQADAQEMNNENAIVYVGELLKLFKFADDFITFYSSLTNEEKMNVKISSQLKIIIESVDWQLLKLETPTSFVGTDDEIIYYVGAEKIEYVDSLFSYIFSSFSQLMPSEGSVKPFTSGKSSESENNLNNYCAGVSIDFNDLAACQLQSPFLPSGDEMVSAIRRAIFNIDDDSPVFELFFHDYNPVEIIRGNDVMASLPLSQFTLDDEDVAGGIFLKDGSVGPSSFLLNNSRADLSWWQYFLDNEKGNYSEDQIVTLYDTLINVISEDPERYLAQEQLQSLSEENKQELINRLQERELEKVKFLFEHICRSLVKGNYKVWSSYLALLLPLAAGAYGAMRWHAETYDWKRKRLKSIELEKELKLISETFNLEIDLVRAHFEDLAKSRSMVLALSGNVNPENGEYDHLNLLRRLVVTALKTTGETRMPFNLGFESEANNPWSSHDVPATYYSHIDQAVNGGQIEAVASLWPDNHQAAVVKQLGEMFKVGSGGKVISANEQVLKTPDQFQRQLLLKAIDDLQKSGVSVEKYQQQAIEQVVASCVKTWQQIMMDYQRIKS
ncbi:MAG: hypothetical protein ACOZAN_01605 [Patescibacteria group bacterium]